LRRSAIADGRRAAMPDLHRGLGRIGGGLAHPQVDGFLVDQLHRHRLPGARLDLGVPNAGSAAQQSIINQAVQYGAQRGVTVNVIPFP
jgi:hypothetical protein